MIPLIQPLLQGDAEVRRVLGDPIRVHPNTAPQGTALPYATWAIAGGVPTGSLSDPPPSDGWRVRLTVWGSDTAQANEAAIERGPSAQGPWTEIHRTAETRYHYSDGSGQKWWFRITPTVRGKPGAGSTVEVTPPTTTADLVEQQEKLAAETLARMRADAAEAAARAAAMAQAAQDLLAEATLRQQQYAEAMQGIADEARARADAVLNEKLAREAAISLEQQTRQSEVESLARQVAEVAAGSGTQFDSRAIWYFDQTVEGWTGNGTPTLVDGWLRPANTSSTPWVQSPAALAVDGSAYRFVKLRVKRVGSPTWAGFLQWITPTDQNWNTQKRVAIAEPAWDASGVAAVDVQDIAWWPGTVDRIRLQLGTAQAVANYYLVDWVAVGRPTPGASVALVQAETVARTNAIAAEASQRNTLAVQMRGNYTGTDPQQLTAGLAYEELKARVAADSAQVQRISSMEARMPAGAGGLATAASVTEEALARVSGDAALAQSITTVNATLPALIAQGSNMVINGGWQSGRDIGWTYSGNGITFTANEGRASGAAIRIDPTAGVRIASANAAVAAQVSPGKKYRYGCWYKTSADFNGTSGDSKIRLANQNGALLGGATFFVAGKDQWTYVGAVYTIPENTSINGLRITIQADNTVGTLWVDDVTLEEVTDLVTNADGLQALTTTVQSQGGQISAQAGLISALRTDVDGKASNSALQSLQSQVSLQGNDITSLGIAMTNVRASLNSVGGDNLLPNSSFEESTSTTVAPTMWNLESASPAVSVAYVDSPLAGGGRAVQLSATTTAANQWIGLNSLEGAGGVNLPRIQPNVDYVLSSNVRGTAGCTVQIIAQWRNSANGIVATTTLPATALTGDWQRLILPIKTTATAADRVRLYVGRITAATAQPISIEIDNVMLQQGTVATAYMPSASEILAKTNANAAATSTLQGQVTTLQGTVIAQGTAITTVDAKLSSLRTLGDNMLPNSDFSTGLQWWAPGGTPVPVWSATAGNGRPGVTMTKVGSANPQIGPSDGQWMPNRGARRYRVIVRAMSVSGDVSMLLRLQRMNRTTSATGNDDKRISLTNAFANYTVDFDPVDDTIGSIRLWVYKTVADGVIRVDSIELYDVTDQIAAAGAASAVSSLQATVIQQGQQITAQASRVDGVQASVAGKADASVVQEMRVQVNNQGGGGNLIPNSGFPSWQKAGWGWYTNTQGWQELGNPTGGPEWAPPGTQGIGSVRGGSVANGAGDYFGMESFIPVEASKTYCISGYVATHRSRLLLYVEWYKQDGGIITQLNTAWVERHAPSPVTLDSLRRVSAIGKAPANAVMCRVIARVEGVGEDSPYFWLFRPMLSIVADGATAAPPWEPGDQASAQWNLAVQANGISAGLQLGVTGQTSALNILASAVNILSPGGADGFELTNGYLRVWSGNSQRIIGNNFGADGLVDYFGPNVGAGNANKANATMWMDRDGNAYWGGSIAAGILRNAAQSTQTITTGNSVLVGPFDTNGRNKQVVVGFNRRHRRIKNAQNAQGFVAGAGTNGGTINLYRQLDGQAETLWQQIPITGSVNIFNQADGPDSADSVWTASLTLNDNANGTTRRSYRAEIVSFTEQTVSHQSGGFDSQTITQSLSIVSIEQ